MRKILIVIISLSIFCAYAAQLDTRRLSSTVQLLNNEIHFFKSNWDDKNKGQEIYTSLENKNVILKDEEINQVSVFLRFARFFAVKKFIEFPIGIAKEFKSKSNTPEYMISFAQGNIDASLDLIKKVYDRYSKIDDMLINKNITVLEHAKKIEKVNEESSNEWKNISDEFTAGLIEIENGRIPRYKRNDSKRLIARNDVVAQVLNYASGSPEDASGDAYYYPVDNENGRCVYKIAINENNPLKNEIQGLLGAGQFAGAMGVQGLSEINSVINNGIDLNKADLKNITFYKTQGAQRNRYTGVTAYLRYTSRVEGLPDIFECDSNSCNIDRLKRGWEIVASKCKGTQKAF